MPSTNKKQVHKLPPAPTPAQQFNANTLWAAKLAHELNNALMAAQSNLDSLKLAFSDLLDAAGSRGRGKKTCHNQAVRYASEIPEMLEDMTSSIEFIADVIVGMREFAQPMPEAPRLFNVLPVIRSALKLARADWPANIKIKSLPANGTIQARGNHQALRQALLNLFQNAARAMKATPGPCALVIRSARRSGLSTVITVSDSGPGIPEANRARIFDPFFTTAKQQGGTGLGLFVSREIIRRMGGDLTLETRPKSCGTRSKHTQAAVCNGATFAITLPS